MILMEHPEHGRTHAYTPSQIDAHKENGWSIVKESREKINITELRRRYRAKFGKKPYHRKTIDDLLEALAQ